jgi:predicted sulfurtransferase
VQYVYYTAMQNISTKRQKKEKSDDAEGLEKEILIAEGVKGLVSGAQGVVKKIKVLMLVVIFQLLFLFN